MTLDLDHVGRVDVALPYEAHGPAASEPVVVLGGISASSHLSPTAADPQDGWWRGVIGEEAGLDPRRQHLVGVEYLAGPHVPLPSEEPVTSHDQARAVARILDDLGAPTAALVGASYGGLVALAFAELFPERVSRLVVFCAGHRAHPMATGLRAIQRAIVKLGEGTDQAEQGVVIARALAMTTYRSAEEFEQRFDVRPVDGSRPPRYPVQDYLEAQGLKFAARFDTRSFYRLSESIDLHSVEPERITVPTTLVSVDSDYLAPPWLIDDLERRAPGVERHVKLESLFGHDAFLKDRDAVNAVLREALPR